MTRYHQLPLQLARACGYCCVHSFLRANLKASSLAISKVLGIEARTYRKWRARFKSGLTSPCPLCRPKGTDKPVPLP